ncbi:MAG: flagellar hook-associated protein FlgK [Acetobacterium sp.]
MSSTFLAFHVASRAMEASQATITVTGNNIANINTEGYTRQRVDINAITSSGSTQKFATPQISTGMGAKAVGTSQMRDPFLDARFRSQNAESSRYGTMVSGLSSLESIFDEAQTDGLQSELSSFINDLQTFSQTPTSSDIAQVTRTAAQKVTQIMNMYANQIKEVRVQQVDDLENVISNDINTIVKTIANLNDQVRKEEIYGNTPNELYDTRNLLIDKLSGIANIKVTKTPERVSENMTIDRLSISLLDPNTGTAIGLVDNNLYNTMSLTDKDDQVVISLNSSFVLAGTQNVDTKDITGIFSDGSVKGYLDLINGKGSFADLQQGENDSKGVAYYEKTMDIFVNKFAEVLNGINKIGTEDKPLFTASDGSDKITAANIQVSQAWLDSPSYINTTNNPAGSPGSSDNILRMVNALSIDQEFEAGAGKTVFKGSYNEYMTGLLGDLALDVDLNTKFASTADKVLQNIFESRESVSGVSLNEEGTNLMAYQKCYNAAIRFFTVLDENVNAVINNMGLAGR